METEHHDPTTGGGAVTEEPPKDAPSDARSDPERNGSTADELAYRLRQQELLVEYGLIALRATQRAELREEAVRVAAEGLNVDLAKYLEYRQDAGDLLIRAGVGWAAGTVGNVTLAADTGSPAGYAYRMKQPVISNHLEQEERFRTPDVLVRHGVRRAINVPVRDRGEPIGVLEVDSPAAGRFTEADIAFLEGLGLMMSAAVERLNAAEALRVARERESLLIGEMRHRVRNLFALMQGIVSMSVRQAKRAGDDVVPLIVGRLDALALATETGLPRATDAAGADGPRRDLLDLTRRVLAPYAERVTISGDDDLPTVADRFQTVVALLLLELATNAVNYGALAGEAGHVEVTWRADAGRLRLDWCESGVTLTSDRSGTGVSGGFGTGMIDNLLKSAGGTIAREMAEGGLRVTAFVGTD